MLKIQKKISVEGTQNIEGLDCPADIVVTITHEDIKRLIGMVRIGVPDFGDRLYFNLGPFVPFDDEGDQMDLDWRPEVAYIVMHGRHTMKELNSLVVNVGSRDTDGVFLIGKLELSESEIQSLLKGDITSEKGELVC